MCCQVHASFLFHFSAAREKEEQRKEVIAQTANSSQRRLVTVPIGCDIDTSK